MPHEDLLKSFPDHLSVAQSWNWNGKHYSRTLESWLTQLDNRKSLVMPILKQVYGAEASRWFQRWRMFLLACSELFGFRDGEEWYVSHHLLQHTDRSKVASHD